jgi:hypothetical protein
MELVIFTLNAIIIYLLSDWLVRRIEQKRGGVLKQRQAIFFAIFVVLALASFSFLKTLFAGP